MLSGMDAFTTTRLAGFGEAWLFAAHHDSKVISPIFWRWSAFLAALFLARCREVFLHVAGPPDPSGEPEFASL